MFTVASLMEMRLIQIHSYLHQQTCHWVCALPSDKSNLHRSHCGSSERAGVILKIGKGNCECLEGTWKASKHPLVTVGC